MPSSSFLRADCSVDLYKARSSIYAQLTQVLGELRDYNGGMLFKQIEQVNALQQALGKGTDSVLLEKFFYALMPMEMRTSLDTETLKQFFVLFLHAVKRDRMRKEGDLFFKQENARVMAVLSGAEPPLQKQIDERLEQQGYLAHRWVHFSLEVSDEAYAGYLLLSEEKAEQERFVDAVRDLL
ncbi:MAG: hypothetical protein HY069_01930 [Chlamydiia bacterium]|nr:hypothetical protein [Chlamydiia bacterium]